ncbi:MAG: CDP-glucose 4,6-dehydratase [Thermoguttaceae bacterium]
MTAARSQVLAAPVPLGQALAGRSVFVTGHTGFKGSWLSIWLHALGARVAGYALDPPTSPSNFAASGVRELLAAHHVADLRDVASLHGALETAAPDVVFHLAAQPLVRQSYADPRETFEVNVMGTVNLLDAIRILGRPCVVLVTTSDKCYENREQTWGYRECDAMGGHDPYSASKGAAEIAVAAYRRSFFPPAQFQRHGVKLASVRAGNVIGGGDWAKDRIVTDVVRHLRAGQPVPIRSPRSIRPWQHVLEPLGGYLTLAAAMLQSDDPVLCEAWNFGPAPGEEIPVCQLVELFVQAWGNGAWQDVSDPHAPHEAGVLRLCIDKALHQLDWRPRWSVAEAVRRTAEWFRRFYASPSPDALAACREDIRSYENSEQGAGSREPEEAACREAIKVYESRS